MAAPIVVGMTYDRREDYPGDEELPADFYGEFDSETTLAALADAIEDNGYSVRRIGNISQLVSFLANGNSVDLMFNIAEGLGSRSRETQVPALLEAFNIPYVFSDPVALGISQDKAIAKRLWLGAGLPTAAFHAIESLEQLDGLLSMSPAHKLNALRYPLFVKPVHEGSSKGVRAQSVAYNDHDLRSAVGYILNTYQQPALAETYLPGREFTAALLGTDRDARVLGVAEVTAVAFAPANGFYEKEHKRGAWRTKSLDPFISVDSPILEAELADLALKAYQVIECRDAGRVDMRLDSSGRPHLLEINALAGLSPTTSALPIIASQAGLTYTQLIGEIIRLAIQRNTKEDTASSSVRAVDISLHR